MIATADDLTDKIARRSETDGYSHADRDETIRAIRTALKRRSGKTWSVRGGRGTGWGWIRICAPRARLTGERVETGERDAAGRPTYEWTDTGEYTGGMTEADMRELGELLNLGRLAHHQGVSVPADNAYYVEYIARAEGRSPARTGTPYWD